ncbi:MAG TPA: hypothetical protein DCP28_01060, partial [Cytophagales bacterium]|nr:hypothetical protein [Cytophagales bacterium]
MFSCGREALPIEQSTSINKIMPLGASRTAGRRPDHDSYRYWLWQDLVANGWTFDFIGTYRARRTTQISMVWLLKTVS